MFQSILIANRGEIALRIIWACRELGIKTVAVYSEADRDSLHVSFADEAICIGPPPAADSYLSIPAVISAAEIMGVDAIHPGYGFLAENAEFSDICETCGLTFIGPSTDAIRNMGDKAMARKTMGAVGLPIILGSEGAVTDEKEAGVVADKIGYPVLLKAAAGGGGKGMIEHAGIATWFKNSDQAASRMFLSDRSNCLSYCSRMVCKVIINSNSVYFSA